MAQGGTVSGQRSRRSQPSAGLILCSPASRTPRRPRFSVTKVSACGIFLLRLRFRFRYAQAGYIRRGEGLDVGIGLAPPASTHYLFRRE